MSKHPTPEHYQRRVGGVLLDPYRIARAYGLEDHALFSALKKVLAAGRRGAKDTAHDVQDAIDALVRWQEMERENATPDPVTAALDAVDSHDPRECAVRIGDLEHKLAAQQMSYESQQIDHLDRIAELERELEQSEARADARLRNMNSARARALELELERDALRQTLDTERQAAVATAEELENRRAVMEATVMELPSDVLQDDERTLAERVRDLRRLRNQVLNDLDRARKKSAELRKAYNEAFDFRDEMRRELGANDDERFPDFLRRICRELAALRGRYRPRRQSEEPAPVAMVLATRSGGRCWWLTHGSQIKSEDYWTHQPPAPEAEREGE